jgi:transcription termination factor NusB
LLREAWPLTIVTLSWIELRRLGERIALARAAKHLNIKDSHAVGLAHNLVFETLRRQNIIDCIINNILAPRSLSEFKVSQKAFLRLYNYVTKFQNFDIDKAIVLARIGRSILGWRQLTDTEETLYNLEYTNQ